VAGTLITPYSPAVKAWILTSLGLVLIVSASLVPTSPIRTPSCLLLLSTSYALSQFGYNLSIRETSSDTYAAILQTFGYEALWFSSAHGAISKPISIIFIVAALISFLDRY
jgi:hypothetical protein